MTPDPMLRPMSTKLIVATAAIGGFLFGYDTAIVNGGLFQMRRSFGFSDASWVAGLIVSSAIAGAAVGALIGGVASDRVGRRRTLAAADVLFASGALIIAAAPNVAVVVIGRIVLGLGVGVASIVVPVYLAELTSADVRGAAIAANNLSITTAQFLAALVAVGFVYAEPETEPNPWGWRCMFGLAAIPAALQLALLRTFPESPSWLRLTGHSVEEVERACQIAGIPNLTLESTAGAVSYTEEPASCLRESLQRDLAVSESESAATASRNITPLIQKPASLLELLRQRDMHRRVVIAMLLQAFQQLAGINTIMYYSATILNHAGFTGNRSPVLFSVPLAATNALFTMVGIWAIERHGRRKLLLGSLLGCTVSTALFASVSFSFPGDNPPRGAAVALIVCLIMYLMCFAPGMGPVPWVVCGEIFPLRYRSAAASVATTVNWASNAAVSQLFPVLIGVAGTGATFSVIVVVCIIAWAVISRVLPETRGVPLEAMERALPPVPRQCGCDGSPC